MANQRSAANPQAQLPTLPFLRVRAIKKIEEAKEITVVLESRIVDLEQNMHCRLKNVRAALSEPVEEQKQPTHDPKLLEELE